MLVVASQPPTPWSLTQKIQHRFNQAANQYDQQTVVQKKIVQALQNLVQRTLADVTHPSLGLDLGCGTGTLGQTVQQNRPQDTILGLDLALDMLHCNPGTTRIQADFHHLPFYTNTFDQLYSSSALHWAHNMPAVAHDMARVLKPGGLSFLGLFLAGSLREIQTSWLQTDGCSHTMDFLTLENYTQIFTHAGLSPLHQQTMEITLSFDSPKAALLSLKKIGSRWLGQKSNLIALSQWKKFEDCYWKDYGHLNQIPLTYTIGLLILKKHAL